MKKLIVQLCAIALCVSAYAPELFGLNITMKNPGQFLSTLSRDASSPAASTGPGMLLEDNAIPGAWESTALHLVGARLFGTNQWGASYYLDSKTLTVAMAGNGFSRVYPVVPVGDDGVLARLAAKYKEGSVPVAGDGSLVLIGFGLIALSSIRKRSEPSVNEEEGTQNAPLHDTNPYWAVPRIHENYENKSRKSYSAAA